MPQIEILGFEVGSLNFAIPLHKVKEIAEEKKVVPVPKAPLYLEGVFNLRGNIVPLLDLKEKFNLDRENGKYGEFFVVIEMSKNRTIALRVDRIIGTLLTDKVKRKIAPGALEKGLEEIFFEGTCEVGGTSLFLINVEKLDIRRRK